MDYLVDNCDMGKTATNPCDPEGINKGGRLS